MQALQQAVEGLGAGCSKSALHPQAHHGAAGVVDTQARPCAPGPTPPAARQAFDDLDAPPERVTGAEVPMPYAANLEAAALPQVRAACVPPCMLGCESWREGLVGVPLACPCFGQCCRALSLGAGVGSQVADIISVVKRVCGKA